MITVTHTAMQKIIGQSVFEGKLAPFVRARARFTNNGHLEVSVTRPVIWHEENPLPRPLDAWEPTPEQQAQMDAEREERSAKRGARLAKQTSRWACKSIGADSLMTLTYRENQRDLALCKAHLKEFVRRVLRVWPGFVAVCAFEEQKRGAWHVHLATQKVPERLQRKGVRVKSFDVLRAIWRSVTKEHGGNVDVQGKRRNSRKSPARIAAYLSKYITKNFEHGEKWSNRWTRYGKFEKPQKLNLGDWPDMRSAIEFAYGMLTDVQRIATSTFTRINDVFFLVAEPLVGAGGVP